MEMLQSFAYNFELILCIPTNHKLGVVHIFGLDLHMILRYRSTCMLMKFLFVWAMSRQLKAQTKKTSSKKSQKYLK